MGLTGAEAAIRVAVTVTFLRMDAPPPSPGPALPAGASVVRVAAPTVGFYRYLYYSVGADYCWWLRRAMSDTALAQLLAAPGVSVHVLYHGGEPAGFFELDERPTPDVNLAYFGLMPHAVGHGMGPAFLRAAVDEAWCRRPRAVTVNTCTADHPRALPTYLRTGFRPIRTVREIWDVPARLGLTIPDHLRA
jgi:GNAT superfamily N-acetyltransferase